MTHSYLLLTPIIILLVVFLAGFVGCEFKHGTIGPPSAPTGLTPVVQDGKITLFWEPKYATGFNIKRGTDPGMNSLLDTALGTASSWEDPSAVEDTRYNYVVSTQSYDDESPDSGEVYATIPTAFIATSVPGAAGNPINGFAGMGFLYNGPPIVVKMLGRFRAPGNKGLHLLKIMERNNLGLPPVELQSVTVDMMTTAENTFAYAELLKEVSLQSGNTYHVVSEESAATGDSYLITGNVTSKFAGVDVYPVIQDGTGPYVAGTGSIANMYGPVDFKYISDLV